MALDLVTFGEAMALLLAEPGVPLRRAVTFRRQVAGAESNVTVALARLGHPVGWFAPSDVDARYLAGAGWLHASGVTPVLSGSAADATVAAVEAARAAGVRVCLSANVRRRLSPPPVAARLLRPLAARADVLVATEEEALLLADAGDLADAVDRLLARGVGLIVITRGARGAWATDGKARFEVAPFPVCAVDPVGAGDAFAAGLLSGLIRRLPTGGALREAAAVAALCAAAPGDLDGLPTAAERDAYLKGGADVAR